MVLVEARGLDEELAYDVLDETTIWRETETHWQLSTTTGKTMGSLHEGDGAVYVVGDVLDIGAEHAYPHRPVPNGLWRVVDLGEPDDPTITGALIAAFTGNLILEPFTDTASLTELGGLFGVTRQTARRYAERDDFPEPFHRGYDGRVWLRRDVEKWGRERLPLPRGRPRKPGSGDG